jgi:hypothetical protein
MQAKTSGFDPNRSSAAQIQSLPLDVGLLDDRPPLLDFGSLKRTERCRGLLVGNVVGVMSLPTGRALFNAARARSGTISMLLCAMIYPDACALTGIFILGKRIRCAIWIVLNAAAGLRHRREGSNRYENCGGA